MLYFQWYLYSYIWNRKSNNIKVKMVANFKIIPCSLKYFFENNLWYLLKMLRNWLKIVKKVFEGVTLMLVTDVEDRFRMFVTDITKKVAYIMTLPPKSQIVTIVSLSPFEGVQNHVWDLLPKAKFDPLSKCSKRQVWSRFEVRFWTKLAFQIKKHFESTILPRFQPVHVVLKLLCFPLFALQSSLNFFGKIYRT